MEVSPTSDLFSSMNAGGGAGSGVKRLFVFSLVNLFAGKRRTLSVH